MQFDNTFISKLETLARLELSSDERAHIAADLEKILLMVQTLSAAPVDGVQPLVYLQSEPAMRPDVVEAHLPVSEALKNAPQHDNAFFITPKVK